MLKYLLLLATLCCGTLAALPVVLVHGIDARNDTMFHARDLIQQALPGTFVVAPNIGDGPHDSVFMNMNQQVALLCEQLGNTPELQGGFNLIGFSQGGLSARGYLERCNVPKVVNFISWVSPQMGVFGSPGVNDPAIDELLQKVPYVDWVQATLSFANYWVDPFNLTLYAEKSIFLADINNVRAHKNADYKKNILSLNSFTMLTSLVDIIVVPRESEWFGFYAANSTSTIVPMEESPLYVEDWIGLRALQAAGKLLRGSTTCEHQDYFTECFDSYFEKYVLPVLRMAN